MPFLSCRHPCRTPPQTAIAGSRRGKERHRNNDYDDTREPDAVKAARPVRRGEVKKDLQWHLVGPLPYGRGSSIVSHTNAHKLVSSHKGNRTMQTCGTRSGTTTIRSHIWSHARIVQFAQEHEASILVFEHLGNLKPEKGKYSKRGNSKRAFWMKGRIFKYSKYKAYNVGILTSRVSPRNTSCTCARCGSPVARYCEGQKPEGYQMGAPLVYCATCGMKGHADRNASLMIGNRLFDASEFLPGKASNSSDNGKGRAIGRCCSSPRAKRPSCGPAIPKGVA